MSVAGVEEENTAKSLNIQGLDEGRGNRGSLPG